MWVFMGGYAYPAGQKTGKQYEVNLRGMPENSRLYTPILVGGRNLSPEDGHAILFNREKLALDMGVGLGDQIILTMEGYEDTTWTIVGLLLDLGVNAGQTPTLYVDQNALSEDINQVGLSTALEVQGVEKTLEMQTAIAGDRRIFLKVKGPALGTAPPCDKTKNRPMPNSAS